MSRASLFFPQAQANAIQHLHMIDVQASNRNLYCNLRELFVVGLSELNAPGMIFIVVLDYRIIIQRVENALQVSSDKQFSLSRCLQRIRRVKPKNQFWDTAKVKGDEYKSNIIIVNSNSRTSLSFEPNNVFDSTVTQASSILTIHESSYISHWRNSLVSSKQVPLLLWVWNGNAVISSLAVLTCHHSEIVENNKRLEIRKRSFQVTDALSTLGCFTLLVDCWFVIMTRR